MAEWHHLVFIALSILKPISASSSMGKMFLVSAPRLQFEMFFQEPFIQFHLCTFSENEVMVRYEGSLYDVKSSKSLRVNNDNVTVYEAEKHLLASHEIGHTATFKFMGPQRFGLTVFMLSSIKGAASFQAVPVDEWGQIYIVVTGMNLPFIQMTSAEVQGQNDIKVSFSDYRESGKAVFDYEQIKYKSYTMMNISLKSWESFTISNCSYSEEMQNIGGRLDGTRIKSVYPVGVISGSCWTYSTGVTCDHYKRSFDMVAEMLLPLRRYHKQFIFPNIPKEEQPTELVVIASKKNTNLSLQHESSTVIACAGDVLKNNKLSGSYSVESDKGALVLYMHTSFCHGAWMLYHPAPNLCIILPTRLFHYTYIWRTAYDAGADFVLLVARIRDKHQLLLDGRSVITTGDWEKVTGLMEFNVANVRVRKGLHRVFSKDMTTFGCYIYGFGYDSAYMHWGGYQECGNGPNHDIYADGIDNDCDGRVDEEMKDGNDNDGDGLVDEDLNDKRSYFLYYVLALVAAVVLAGCVAFFVIHRKLKATHVTEEVPDLDEVVVKEQSVVLGMSEHEQASETGSRFTGMKSHEKGSEVDDRSYVNSEPASRYVPPSTKIN